MQGASLSIRVKRLVATAALLGIVGGVTTGIAAEEPTSLRGSLFIAGKTPLDPPPEEPNSTHAYMTIEGAAALKMYRAMKAKERDDACEEGWRSKSIGELTCSISANRKEAHCDFSVDLVHGRLAGGRPC
jgi:hypothetical protein